MSGHDITFNPGDVVDVNIQQVLGNINTDNYVSDVKLPGSLTNGNPVFDLNDPKADHGLGTGH